MAEREGPYIVTIDGPAGVGKSTLAGLVAQRLGLARLDTGAMYRAAAWMLGAPAREASDAGLAARLEGIRFELDGEGPGARLLVNGQPLPPQIRDEAVGLLASDLAVRAPMRAFQKAAQQALGAVHGLVAEGRDMGTNVFPQAKAKFFLEASPEVRAARRVEQLKALGQPADFAAIAQAMRERDAQDRTRALNPLVPAPDACVIDTSGMDIPGVLAAILAKVPPRA